MADNVVKRVSTIFTIKDDGFNKSLSDINKQMKLTQSEIKLAGERVNSFGGNTDDLKYKQEALAKQISNVKDKMALYSKSIDDNNNNLNKNKAELSELGKKKDDLNAKYKESIKLYSEESEESRKLKVELDKTKEAYKEKENVVKSNINAINNHTTDLKKTETELVKLQGELKKANSELSTAESKWLKAGKALETSGESIKNFGNKVSSAGNTLSVGVTLPILAVGTAATKMAMDTIESENLFEVSMGKMSQTARKWTDETAKSLGLNAYELRKNVGTFNVMLTAMGQTEEKAYEMSTSFSKLAYDMASFYNLDPSQAFDKLRAGISGEAEPLKQLGIVINETAIKNYALEKGLIRQIPVLDKHGKAVTDSFGKIKTKTEELDDATKVQARYGLIMELTAKAQGDLSRTMDSPTNKLRIQTERIKQQATELGVKLIPLMEKGLNITGKIVDWLDSLNDEQKDLIIKIGLVTAAAGPLLGITGKFISVVGSLVGTIGKVSSSLGAAKVATSAAGAVAGTAGGTAGFGALANGLGTVALAAAPYVAAGVAIAGAGYLVYKGLQEETVPAVDLFADRVEVTAKDVSNSSMDMATQTETSVTKISEATKTAVGAYIKMDDEVTKVMTDLYVNSSTITSETANSLTSKFNEMGNQIKAGIDKKYSDTYATMQTFFKESGALADIEEAEALRKLKENAEFQKGIVDQGTKEIQVILDRAAAANRKTTEEENNIISNIKDNMKKNAIQSLSETEVESKVILERLKSYSSRITAEQSAEVVKNANTTRDKAVNAANEQYDKTVASIIKMRDESKVITAEQADIAIRDATRQKDSTIEKAEEMRIGVIDKLRQMNPDVEKEVNFQTGTIMTAWDKVKTWWNNLSFNKKTMEVTTKHNSTQDYTNSPIQYEYSGIPMNALGTNYFPGGLTYYNEKGYELINLPAGSKIKNHAQSESIVRKTAEEVARSILSGIGQSSNDTPIIIPIYMDSEKVAEATSSHANKIQGFNVKFGARGQGIG
jgi:phage-related tail protein